MNIEVIGQGQTVVLLHGFGFNRTVFYPLVEQCKEKLQFYLIDLPGLAQGEVVEKTSIIDFCHKLKKHLPNQFVIGGWSLGGLMAYCMAIEFRERVQGLLTIASTPCFIEEKPWPGSSKARFVDFKTKLVNQPQKALQELLHLQFSPATHPKSLMKQARHQMQMAAATPLGLENGIDWLIEGNALSELSTLLNCPSLHFFGLQDRLVPAETMDALRTFLPKAETVAISDGAHHLLLTHLKLIKERLLLWHQTLS